MSNNNSLKVLLAGAECAPFVKLGGLADVMGTLPKELNQIGADARLVDPLVEELLAQGRVGLQGLGHEVLQVDDLDALFAQNTSEGIVLGLGRPPRTGCRRTAALPRCSG